MSIRVQYIDGLRGIAIIFVVLFHAYARWGSVEPFEQVEFLKNTFIYGWLGVQLFFAISGYVIYMSVLRSDNLIMFATARYLRLAPAMLIASILIYSTSYLIPERPLGVANLVDFLPSLTFIDPSSLSKITGLDVGSLDGAFWSLYVEVKFYFVVAIAFFIVKDKGLNLLLLLFLGWLCLSVGKYFYVESVIISTPLRVLNYAEVKYYGWFLLGVYAYKFDSNRTPVNLVALSVIAVLATLTTNFGNLQITIAAIFVVALFLLPLFFAQLRSILSSKVFLFFGFVSYPLYLIHQNIVTGLAIKLHGIIPNLPSYFYPIPFLILVIFVSFGIAKLEPSLNYQIRNFIPKKFFRLDVLK